MKAYQSMLMELTLTVMVVKIVIKEWNLSYFNFTLGFTWSYSVQSSFMLRTRPQSLRQETLGRLRGPWWLFIFMRKMDII